MKNLDQWDFLAIIFYGGSILCVVFLLGIGIGIGHWIWG